MALTGIVNIQAQFDPLVKPEDVLAKGNLGEFYNSFYQGEQLSVWINASPRKVQEYLNDPRTWQKWKDKYGYDFGQCLAEAKPGVCKAKIRILGADTNIDSFAGRMKYGEYSTAYWVSKPMMSRVHVMLKPDQGGTEFEFQYMTQLPYVSSDQQADLMMSMLMLPKVLEEFMMDIKKDNEGTI